MAVAALVVLAAVIGGSLFLADDPQPGERPEPTERAAPSSEPAPSLAPSLALASTPEATTDTFGGSPPGPLLGEQSGLTLLIKGPDGTTQIDLDTGASIDLSASAVADADADELAIVGSVVVAVSAHEALVFLDGREAGSVGPADTLFVQPGEEGQVWLVAAAEGSSDVRLSLVASDGAVREVTTLSRGFRAIGATRSGLVVASGGLVFVVQPGGLVVSLGPGEVRAVSDRMVVLWRCDAVAACATVAVDPATGDRVETAVDFGASDRLAVALLSPDGSRLARYSFSNVGLVGFDAVDAATGERYSIYEEGTSPYPMAWSPDGRWLFWTRNGELVAHDITTKTTRATGLHVPGRNDLALLVGQA